jgi:hypothetical protein
VLVLASGAGASALPIRVLVLASGLVLAFEPQPIQLATIGPYLFTYFLHRMQLAERRRYTSRCPQDCQNWWQW